MSVQSKFLPRLGLESLETREVPAVVFVGGWGASMYQYAHNDPAADAGDDSAIAFVGGWGSSAEPSAAGSLGIEVHVVRTADPLPVLLVIADQRDFDHSSNGGVGDSRSPALRKGGWVMDVTLPSSADGRVTDDVVVDGRIITGENYDSVSVAASGYIRIKKLNSGG